ncbi:uncharacterized protein LOC116028877 [Ipomoea triloba]|uniref:uncharacterized protein LOC116028877 n=1 Tax=Ipomoea triloba TaxID=35885 RepID=UPI00125CF445|nr:uncharacterized protein LOC116028877 [Ipomoea triloba]
MLRDGVEWSKERNLGRMVIESDDERVLEKEEWEGTVVGKCREKVNCVAECLVKNEKEGNVIYLTREAMSRSFRQVLDLEGLPHFFFSPSVYYRWKWNMGITLLEGCWYDICFDLFVQGMKMVAVQCRAGST